jgi:type I restriction enzyme S subunit
MVLLATRPKTLSPADPCNKVATRDKLTAASLARLNAPDPKTFHNDACFALNALPALTIRPDQIKQLRQTILNLALCGKLVPQDPKDEPGSELLKRIARERATRAAKLNTRAKRTLRLSEAVGGLSLPDCWEIEALANLVDPTASISYGVLVPGPDVEEGAAFVRAQDLFLSGHPDRPSKTIAPEIEAAYARTRLRGGEILLCVVGSIGKLGTVPEWWAGANIARAVARIAPVEIISSAYLLIALRSSRIQNYFTDATRTLAQPTLNVGLIEKVPIPVPPLAEQHRIVAKVDELMALCDRLETSLASCAATRRRLLDAVLAEALVANQRDLWRAA